MARRPDLQDCLLRRILEKDHFCEKKKLVHARAFRSKTPLSMTATQNKIVGQEDLEDYLTHFSIGRPRRLGVAVLDEGRYLGSGFPLTPDPLDGKYGELHVNGPDNEMLTAQVRDDLAALANDSGWSIGPES